MSETWVIATAVVMFAITIVLAVAVVAGAWL